MYGSTDFISLPKGFGLFYQVIELAASSSSQADDGGFFHSNPHLEFGFDQVYKTLFFFLDFFRED